MNQLLFCKLTLTIGLLLTVAMTAEESSAATNRFCTGAHYHYWDSNQGEDRLTEAGVAPAGVIMGTSNLEGVWADLYQWNGAQWNHIQAGWLDSTGCTALISIPAGVAVGFQIRGAVRVGQSYAEVKFDQGSGIYTRWMGHRWTKVTHTNHAFGVISLGDAVINTVIALSQADKAHSLDGSMGLTTTQVYEVFAKDNTCGTSISCFWNDKVFLGEDPSTGWDYESKSVIGHEFGHNVQDRLFGSPTANRSNPYEFDDVYTGCNCDQVPVPGGTMHCLQSKEHYEASVGEGWGHYYASRMYNIASQSSAFFGYYKNAYPDAASHPVTSTGSALSTPVSVPLLSKVEWLQSHCNQSDMATERDFLGFFYSANTQGADKVPIQSVANVFMDACGGGKCTTSDTVGWIKLFNSAAILPAAQRIWFRIQAAEYGVDN